MKVLGLREEAMALFSTGDCTATSVLTAVRESLPFNKVSLDPKSE